MEFLQKTFAEKAARRLKLKDEHERVIRVRIARELAESLALNETVGEVNTRVYYLVLSLLADYRNGDL